jgi:hypothetical protein
VCSPVSDCDTSLFAITVPARTQLILLIFIDRRKIRRAPSVRTPSYCGAKKHICLLWRTTGSDRQIDVEIRPMVAERNQGK